MIIKPLRFLDLADSWLDVVRAWTSPDKAAVTSAQRAVGQRLIVDLEVVPGAITGRYRRPDDAFIDVHIAVSTISAADWTSVESIVAQRSGHIAALLANQLTVEFDSALLNHDINLLPEPSQLVATCSCDEVEMPCRHAVTLAVGAGPQIVATPTTLLRLRGRDADALIDAHRAQRRQVAATTDAVDTETEAVLIAPKSISERTETMPSVPAVAAVPGEPTGWPSQPPSADAELNVDNLDELAADAIERAWAVAAGEADSRLRLPIDVDLARRAVGHVGSSRIIELAKLIDVDAPRVISLATAWETAGPAGLDLLDAPKWYPTAAIMEEARNAVIDSGRRESSVKTEANTITVADKMQYRFGTDHQWYRFELRSGHWHLFIEPAAALEDVLAVKKK